MVFWAAGLEMMLVAGVSRRMLPLLERHMRDADCVGGVPPGACVLVAQSEQDGGVGGTEGSDTGRKSITVLFGGARSMRPDCDRRVRERCSPSVGIPVQSPSPDGCFYRGAKWRTAVSAPRSSVFHDQRLWSRRRR